MRWVWNAGRKSTRILSRQDVCDKMVPVDEPALPEDVQDFEHGGAILLNPF